MVENATGNAVVSCNVLDADLVRLWQLLQRIQLEVRKFNVSVTETYLYGEMSRENYIRELAHFLKCREISVGPI